MKINKRDIGLVASFLYREAQDFRYVEEIEGGKAGRRERLRKVVKLYLAEFTKELESIEGKANFIVIESITNLGAVNRELRITPAFDSWEWNAGDVVCTLPPVLLPRGFIYIQRRERKWTRLAQHQTELTTGRSGSSPINPA